MAGVQRWSSKLAAGLGGGVMVCGGLLWGPSALAESRPADPTPLADEWRPATEDETAFIWRVILQSPLGIAALNQLAIEGFINPTCTKTLHAHETFETFQTLLQVECPTPGGVSTARAYDEMRVTLNRFEDTIMDFDVERIYVD